MPAPEPPPPAATAPADDLPLRMRAAELLEVYRRRRTVGLLAVTDQLVAAALPFLNQEDRLRELERRRSALAAVLGLVAGGPFARILRWVRLGSFVDRAGQATSLASKAADARTKLEELRQEFERALKAAAPDATTRLGLTGLALSGGGIRSATFNLGVLQGLVRHDLLHQIDYLSTVSGGGFIGSCLSTVLNDSKTAPRQDGAFPLAHGAGGIEPPAVKHLRNHANYLSSRALTDRLRIFALLIRGIVLNLAVLLPYILLAAVLTAWWRTPALTMADVRPSDFYTWTPWAAGFALAWIVVSPLVAWVARRWLAGSLRWRDRFERMFSWALLIVAGVAAVESAPAGLLVFHSGIPGLMGAAENIKDFWVWVTGAAAVVSALTAGALTRWTSQVAGRVALVVMGLVGPAALAIVFFGLTERLVWHAADATVRDYYILAAMGLWAYSMLFVDANHMSLHGFYRDKLSRAYLFCGPGRDASPRLSNLNAPGTAAPYHLVNAALNLQGSRALDLRGRDADFFVFSKHFCGSPRTGYTDTAALEKADRRLDLATAVAVSGAAVAPNMGRTTIRPLVFIMTMLNVRLGYWLPNPRLPAWRERAAGFVGVGPVYLLIELFGRPDERSPVVNVSDGGHIENLGLYELLRRRCEFIIVSDAEEDEAMQFGGLATVLRYARIDLGIDIDMDLEDLRRDEDGRSRSHAAIGKIRYPGGEVGRLLYLKSSLTGDENPYVTEYKARSAAFPHEGTTNQFFSEEQFEAYRSLGFHVVERLFQHRSADWRGHAVD